MRCNSRRWHQIADCMSASTGLVSLWASLAATASVLTTGTAGAGTLNAFMFDDVVIVWKSQRHLEVAADLVKEGKAKNGDFESLVQCWVSSGRSAEMLSSISGGLLVEVCVDGQDCEGVVFAEEYRE